MSRYSELDSMDDAELSEFFRNEEAEADDDNPHMANNYFDVEDQDG